MQENRTRQSNSPQTISYQTNAPFALGTASNNDNTDMQAKQQAKKSKYLQELDAQIKVLCFSFSTIYIINFE